MKIKNSLMPYPVLSSFNSDYRDSRFTTDIQPSYSLDKVKFTIHFQLENEQIQSMISKGEALYLVHLESPDTSYREIRTANIPDITVEIDKQRLSNRIEVSTFIIAAKNINGYCNDDFNELDAGFRFSLEKGNVIATGITKEYEIRRKEKESGNQSGLIKIQKGKLGKRANIYVDTDNEKYIIVSISPNLLDLYYALGKRKYKNTLFSLLTLPVMTIVLSRMRDDTEGAFAEATWYQAICDLLERNGYDLNALKVQDNSLLEAVQVIFENPIEKALNEIITNDEEER